MKFAKPLLISFSLLAFAGAAYANEGAKQGSASQGGASASQGGSSSKPSFSELDRNNDGTLSRMEAAADANAKSSFEKLDKNRDEQLSQQEYQSAQQQSQAQGQSASAGASSGQSSSQSQQQGQMPASQLIGKKVMDSQGKELGEVSDVVLDLQSAKVHAAVLEFGGILGVGEKNYAFPISQLKQGKNKNQFTMDIDKQKLENAQGFAKGQWPEMDDEYWGRVGGQASAGQTGSQGQQQGQKQSMVLVRASELKGKSVHDKNGQEAGEIRDVIVDLKSGQLRNIVIDVQDGGRANVQANSLTKGTGEQFVLGNMTADQLRSQAKKSGKSAQSGASSTSGASTGASGADSRTSSQDAASRGISGGAAIPGEKKQ